MRSGGAAVVLAWAAPRGVVASAIGGASAAAAPPPTLRSLTSLSRLLASNYTVLPGGGNVNLVRTSDAGPDAIPVCYLPALFAFTPYYEGEVGSYEKAAAAALAMEHLNSGDGSVVPELTGLNDRCPLRFVTGVYDTEGNRGAGVERTIELTVRTREDQLLPSAILGASYSSISIPTSIISGLRDIPQVSPISTSSQLDDKDQYKLFGRTIPHDGGTAVSLLARLASWDVNYLAVLHVDDTYGGHFANEIRLAAEEDHPDVRVITVKLLFDASDEAIERAVRTLRESEARYFFGIVYSGDVDRIMTEAHRQGIAGTGEHNWLFGDGVGSDFALRDFPKGSPLEEAYRGTGVLAAAGGIPGAGKYDALFRTIRGLGENEEDRAFVASLLPTKTPEEAARFENYTVRELDIASPFLYDAAVALGLAACELASSRANGDDDYFFSGEELYRTFLNTTFEGVSGEIVVDPRTGTRTPSSTLYSLVNFVDDDGAGDGVGPGSARFRAVQTDLFRKGEWEGLVPYTFNDGSSDVPSDLPELVLEENHLTLTMKIVGSILCGITVLLSLGFGVWTCRYANKGVVRASQPFFLHFIAAGTALMGLSLVPLTIDLGVADQKGANAACIAFPWLLTAGFSLTFSALFTKTIRIARIMKMASRCTRMKLAPTDVAKPMVALLLLNIAVLTVWTIVDPLEMQTEVLEIDQFDRIEEISSACGSKHSAAFIATLCVINLGSLLFALYQAYLARNLSTEYQESQFIFMGMTLNMVMSLVGIPVLIMTRDNVAAHYFVTASLIFVGSNSILLLLFVPKVLALWERMRNPRPSESRVSMSGDHSFYGVTIENGALVQAALEEENRELRKENRELSRLLTKKSQCSDLEEAKGIESDKGQPRPTEAEENSGS